MWRLQYLCGGFSTFVEASVLTQRLQYLCGGFSTYAEASVLMWRLQYLCGGFCTYVEASVLMRRLPYLWGGFCTYVLRSARADYDTITIRPEVNGHVEPLTDPHVQLPIYDDVLLTETKY